MWNGGGVAYLDLCCKIETPEFHKFTESLSSRLSQSETCQNSSSSPLEVLQLHCVSQQLQELTEGCRLLIVPEQLLLGHLVDS